MCGWGTAGVRHGGRGVTDEMIRSVTTAGSRQLGREDQPGDGCSYVQQDDLDIKEIRLFRAQECAVKVEVAVLGSPRPALRNSPCGPCRLKATND